jgi:hypothetical protein
MATAIIYKIFYQWGLKGNDMLSNREYRMHRIIMIKNEIDLLKSLPIKFDITNEVIVELNKQLEKAIIDFNEVIKPDVIKQKEATNKFLAIFK